MCLFLAKFIHDDNRSPDSEFKKKTKQKYLLDRDCTEIITVLTTAGVIIRDTFINDKKLASIMVEQFRNLCYTRAIVDTSKASLTYYV